MARWGRPGKTPPLLLDDIFHYDLHVPAERGHHPWRDGPPIYEDEEAFEIERRTRSCHHQYIIKTRQSSVPPLDDRPVPNAVYNVAAVCQKCRSHIKLEVLYPHTLQFRPCPDANRPFHHLVYQPRPDEEGQAQSDFAPGKGPEYRQKFIFQCSWPECAAAACIKLKEPVIKDATVHLLADAKALWERQTEAIKAEPTKMEGMSRAENFEVLSDLRQYIRNAWDKTRSPGNTGGKIQLLNKRFMMRFGLGGMPCQSALESLGFTLKPNEYWDPPHPNFDDEEPLKDPFNIFLDDADYELSILMQQHPPRLRAQGTTAPLPSALREFNRVLGSQDYDKVYAARTQDMSPAQVCYRGLGITPDVSDDIVVYAYRRQCTTDPNNAHRYLGYLDTIVNNRSSEILQMELATEVSAGKFTLLQLEESYIYFGFDPRNPPTDEQNIIGTFLSRLQDAPAQESEMRQSLRNIGTHLKSQYILGIADESLTTYDQALEFLGINRDTPDDFVTATIAVKLGDNLSQEERGRTEERCRKAVRIIADHRHSLALDQWLQTGQLGSVEMDIGEAYSLLGIDDRTLEDQMIITTYQLRLEDNKDNADTYNRALRTIAKHKNSATLDQFLFGNGMSTNLALPEWPIGLGNIGNTCYLNSLLQFCFTIKGLRDIVLNFNDYRMDINAETVSHKQVSSRKVSRSEIQRSQRFVEELKKLFEAMITTPKATITPEESLARLTLIGPSTYEAARRRSTLHGQPPILQTVDKVAAADPAPTESNVTIIESPVETLESPVDTTLITTGGFKTNDSSEGTLASRAHSPQDEVMTDADTKEQQEKVLNDKENLPPSKEISTEAATSNDPHEALPLSEASPSKINIQAGRIESKDESMDMSITSRDTSAPQLGPPNRPPPVPPRPRAQPHRKSTIQDLEDITKQQDVTEVMGNVLFQLSCAIKPITIDKEGEQLDQIKSLFFGKIKTTTLDQTRSVIDVVQRFSDIQVDVAQGPRDIYQALEAAFDAEEIISNGKPALQYAAITQLPPIFQVQIRRSQFDLSLKRSYKSVNHLELFQTIFLDRFLDEGMESPLMDRRREVWEWKKELAAIESRQTELVETKDHPDASQSLDEARQVLLSLQTTLSEGQSSNLEPSNIVSPTTISSLEYLSSSARLELSSISNSLTNLRQKISSQYTDLRSHPYSLHSIFVHRGSSSFGHYWIYIYDFDREIWRKYNDSNVTEVTDTNEIFRDLEKQQNGGVGTGASPPTSVYLVYVKESERQNLVGSVFRNPVPPDEATQQPSASTDVEMMYADSGNALATAVTNNEEPSDQMSRFSFESSDNEHLGGDRGNVNKAVGVSGTWDDAEAAPPPPPILRGRGGDGDGDESMGW